MKIRAGFVSNSSSSSFVVVLPENFIEKIDFDKITDGDDEFPLDNFKSLLNDLVRDGGMCDEEIYGYDEDGDFDFGDHLHDLLDPYIIASFEGGPDDGQIVVADRNEIIKILGL